MAFLFVLYPAFLPAYLAGMITDQYLKDLDTWAQYEARTVADNLIAVQSRIARVYYSVRTGRLVGGLTRDAIEVGSLSESLQLVISYPLHIRFNDMKKKPHRKCGGVKIKHRRGKAYKKNYAPIYNKYVYGFLLKGLYVRLRRRIGDGLEDSLRASLNEISFYDGK